MTEPLRFVLNGSEVVEADVDPHESLLAYLRRHGQTACKEGCGEGECGACAVAWRRPDDGAARGYETVNACLLQAVAAHGAEVWTAEGVTGVMAPALHPVQRGIAEGGGSQCGYCTPGFVMSLFSHYYRQTRLPVHTALSGNLCRCTGYRALRDATVALPAPSADDPFLQRLERPLASAGGHSYGHADVRYERPTALDVALRLRAATPDARIVAGGTDVGVELSRERARAGSWIAVDRVRELRQIDVDATHVTVGAAVTLAELEDGPAAQIPLMSTWMPLFASRTIRARATLGGNLMTASPVGDSAPLLLALDADVCLQRTGQERWLPLDQFFVDYRRTALAADELLTHIRIPRTAPDHGRFYKVSKRVWDDISCVAAAMAVRLDGERIASARLAFGGVAATPARALAAEQALVGQPCKRETFARAREALDAAFEPLSDVRGSADYRRAMVVRLFDKFVHEEGL